MGKLAKEVARKVKAARVIQEIARDVYAFKKCESVDIELRLSQHEATARLQKWMAWSAAICKRRLNGVDVEEILQLFRLPPKEKKHLDNCLSFEELTMQMRRPDVQQKATAIVDCLLPIIDIHFAIPALPLPYATPSPICSMTSMTPALPCASPKLASVIPIPEGTSQAR